MVCGRHKLRALGRNHRYSAVVLLRIEAAAPALRGVVVVVLVAVVAVVGLGLVLLLVTASGSTSSSSTVNSSSC